MLCPFHAEKSGTQFWSGETNHCPVPGCASAVVTTTIPVVVTVEDTDGDPEPNLPVYAFDETTYSGYHGTTDVSGTVTLTLPAGDYRFRADESGTHFWSGETNHCTLPGCTGASVTTTIPLVVVVTDTDGGPEEGLQVYAFDEATYSGYNGTTDASGQVTLTLPLGDYRFRADKDGTHFWSGETNHCTVPGCTSAAITTTTPGVTVVVEDTNGDPEQGLPVYAFDGTTYSGYNGTTNVSGTLTLLLPEGNYRFRADKNGTQFWSGEANHCTVPGCAGATITTTIPVVVTVEDTNGDPEQGLPVYAFDDASYTGYNKTTDANGQATFTLPLGDYRFRADKNGTQFWSGEANHCTVPGCMSTTVTTTIPVVVTVEDGDGNPEPNLPVYAFDDTTYSGYNGTTDVSGTVTLTLPAGDYRFRADESGEQYWSGASNHCTVPGCTEAAITVGSQAMGSPAGGVASGYSLPDLGLLLMAPLAVAALGRRKRWQHWTWPLAGVLLVVAVASSGAALADTPAISLESGQMPQVRVPALSENDLLLASAPAAQPEFAPRAQSAGTITTTRVISYTYDPLGRLVEADYSTGESYEYQYDAVGNRTAMTATHESRITQYEYDAANRLTSVDGVTYTWDARGNLTHDGTFTYTYNSAGRMVQAQGITGTLVYTYNAAGLRVAQSVESGQSVFSWDWASGIPEMLSEGDNLYLVGHETLGQWDGAAWAYYLPDALGSVRQMADGAGTVISSREWMPFGMEVGAGQAGLGYTGEWFDDSAGMVYLRARWFDGAVGRFTSEDPWEGEQEQPQTLHPYVYVHNNAVNFTDPSGMWRDPTPDERASINLDETWIASRKPRCCSLYEGQCDDICVGRRRTGVTIEEHPYTEFHSADDYMSFWLAWEYVVEENRCVYREHANCIGTALEVSYLLTKPWVSADIVFKQHNERASYFDPGKWSDVAKEAGFYDQGTHRWGDVTFFPFPGDLLSLAPWRMRISKYVPQHMVVVVPHFSGGEILCFEKQSPGTVFPQHYEIWYYQLRPCKSIALEWNHTYVPPFSIESPPSF